MASGTLRVFDMKDKSEKSIDLGKYLDPNSSWGKMSTTSDWLHLNAGGVDNDGN